MYRPLSIAILLLLSLPQAGWSQKNMSIPPGTRLRVTQVDSIRRGSGSGTTARTTHVGSVIRTVSDTVVLKIDKGGVVTAFPLSTLSSVESSTGTATHVGSSAFKGLLIGAGAGAFAGFAATAAPNASGGEDWRGLAAIGGGLIGAVIGAVVGIIVGTNPTEKWSPIPSLSWRGSMSEAGPIGVSLRVPLNF